MMKKSKLLISVLSIICCILILSACSNGKADYTSVQGFEFHFVPEEYESTYSNFTQALNLESNRDYRLQLDAKCDNGTMEICVEYGNAERKEYSVNANSPCNELIDIQTNNSGKLIINVSIEPDTEGQVIGNLLSNK